MCFRTITAHFCWCWETQGRSPSAQPLEKGNYALEMLCLEQNGNYKLNWKDRRKNKSVSLFYVDYWNLLINPTAPFPFTQSLSQTRQQITVSFLPKFTQVLSSLYLIQVCLKCVKIAFIMYHTLTPVVMLVCLLASSAAPLFHIFHIFIMGKFQKTISVFNSSYFPAQVLCATSQFNIS